MVEGSGEDSGLRIRVLVRRGVWVVRGVVGAVGGGGTAGMGSERSGSGLARNRCEEGSLR